MLVRANISFAALSPIISHRTCSCTSAHCKYNRRASSGAGTAAKASMVWENKGTDNHDMPMEDRA